ncbi:2,3-dihydro-2,3-dihydroxybenzoate dehydrogenase [Actinoplanes sp. NPDC049265]|uniref:2,3-dihydro-2,3-dihydroxybenzoate dehydrogenase n=1 Tax=Actinoplanes sp. NPDC049265 TaxID=3363902 RepID=UPI003719673C
MNDTFTAKVAVVTGAAGGIGATVAAALADRGATVIAVDRDADRLGRADRRLIAMPADVTDAGQVSALVDAAEQRVGPIGLLVNAAGVLHPGRAVALADRGWRETFAVNTTGVFLMSRTVAARMVPRGTGAIVTVGSNAGATPRVGMSAYAASKAAAAMFTRCLGLELAASGIRCNVVAPGSTDTAMLRALWANGGDRAATIDGSPDDYRLGIPLRRLAQPADVAEAVLFLLSDRARHITMHELTVDGGASLGV